jgi:hypothetical protein
MQREITVTVAKVVSIEEGLEGIEVIELEPEIFVGKVDLKKAEKLITKANPDKALKVVSVELIKRKYEMPVLDFIAHATVIDGEPVTSEDLGEAKQAEF